MTYCSREDGCTMCDHELCDGDRKAHLRCMECEHCYLDRRLEYYPVYRCSKANDREIRFDDNGWDRMVWCPVFPER